VTAAFDVVTVEAVTKVFGGTRALGGVTARFEKGTLTALVGPNGSGKSTLLSVLATLVRPTSGRLRFGERTADRDVRGHIGLLAHAPLLWADLTPRENLEVFATLHGLGSDDVARAIDREGASEYADRPARGLSRGQLQRVSLARALLGNPRLLLLDEPTTGLDTEAVSRLGQRLREERDRGAIVVLATHDAGAKALADRTIALDRGKVVS